MDGSYGFRITGTNNAVGQYALVGHFSADGVGHFSGQGTQSVNGTVDRPSFTGTYSVSPDCSGTATFTFPDGTVAPLDLVIEAGGRQIEIIVSGQNGKNTGEIETGTATKQ
jgi:hypothetical protein